VEAGAVIVDVMADLYDPSPRQISYNSEAAARQMELIKKIHSMGAQVVMSAHTRSFLNFEETLAILQAMEQRGADIVKIVNTADTPDELAETIRTTMLLKEKLNKPFIHLCSGKYRYPHRFFGSTLGASLVFGVHSYNNPYTFPQPTLRSLRQCLDSMNWSVYDLD
jgi:3-dehydroquinate dehydratase